MGKELSAELIAGAAGLELLNQLQGLLPERVLQLGVVSERLLQALLVVPTALVVLAAVLKTLVGIVERTD